MCVKSGSRGRERIRFDVKIRIDRPTREAAREIFGKYCTAELPWRPGETPATAIEAATAEMFAADEAHRFLEVTYASGEKETLYFKDFVSGALIESVCTRAKKAAVKRLIATGVKGLTAADLVEAVKTEFRENAAVPPGEREGQEGGDREHRALSVRRNEPMPSRGASHVCPKSGRISRAPGPLQDAGPAGRPGSVAVSRVWRDGGAEERPRRDDPEQGRPVLDEAPGGAEGTRGEGRHTYDTHD